MSPKRRVLTALTGGTPDRVPASCVTQVGIKDAMAAVDAYFPEAHKNAEKMAKLGSSLWELAGLEVARVPFCLTVIAEAFGCGINFGNEERTPSVEKHLNSVDNLKVPEDLLERGRIPVVRDAVKILRSTVGDKLPIVVGMEGPFTLAGHLAGIEQLIGWCLTNPEKVNKLLEVTTEAIITYASYIFKAGADVVCIADPSASPNLLDPAMFKAMVKPKLSEIVENVGGLTVLHICGDVTKILADMAECGFNGLSIEEEVNVSKARGIVGDDVTLIGNISAKQTLPFGKPEQVKAEALKALQSGVDILAPGCGLPPITPIQNVVAIVQAAKEWNQPRKKMVAGAALTPESAKEIGYGIGEALARIIYER
ncbi:MAG: [methyl-Co(III) methanol/glycine betaine-specific corrinoid protein]:coenzyme methyltransferase [Archaeoglobaceae archaeon]|nr:[methyl-Co(III) methanol/glycine betaine-specific corrinoid protein]:coenzyme methyltransferase [Archaeoglobaceae archaeon]